MRTIAFTVTAVLSLALLAACGGSGGSSPEAATQAPTAAPTSTQADAVVSESTATTVPTVEATRTAAPALTMTPMHSSAAPVMEPRHCFAPDPPIIDWQVALDFNEQVNESTAIFIGRIIGEAGVVNVRRDVNDPTKPDSGAYGIGQLYHVAVERYLKGSGEATVTVMQNEGSLSCGPDNLESPPSEAVIAEARAKDFGQTRFNAEQPYLFFTRPLDPMLDCAECLAGTSGLPWIYALTSDGQAVPQLPFPDDLNQFPPVPQEELFSEIEMAMRDLSQ